MGAGVVQSEVQGGRTLGVGVGEGGTSCPPGTGHSRQRAKSPQEPTA